MADEKKEEKVVSPFIKSTTTPKDDVKYPVEILCEEAGLLGYKQRVFLVKEKLQPDQLMTRDEFDKIYEKRYGLKPQR